MAIEDRFSLTPLGQELAMSCYRLAMKMARNRLTIVIDRCGLDRRHYYDRIEDFRQEAFIALCTAASEFDYGRGLKFSTLAWTHIKNRLMGIGLTQFHPLGPSWVARCSGQPKNGTAGVRIITGRFGAGWTSAESTITELLEDRQVNVAARLLPIAELPEWKLLQGMVPPRWWDVLMRRANGETLEAIATSQGCTKQNIQALEQRALERLRLSKIAERFMFDV